MEYFKRILKNSVNSKRTMDNPKTYLDASNSSLYPKNLSGFAVHLLRVFREQRTVSKATFKRFMKKPYFITRADN